MYIKQVLIFLTFYKKILFYICKLILTYKNFLFHCTKNTLFIYIYINMFEYKNFGKSILKAKTNTKIDTKY